MEKKTVLVIIFISLFLFSFGAGNKDKRYTTPTAVENEERNLIIDKEQKDGSMNQIVEDDKTIVTITTEQAVKKELNKQKPVMETRKNIEPIEKNEYQEKKEVKLEKRESGNEKEMKEYKVEKEKEMINKPLYSITLSIPIKNIRKSGSLEHEKLEERNEETNNDKKWNDDSIKTSEKQNDGRALNQGERNKIAEILDEKKEIKESGINQKDMGKYSKDNNSKNGDSKKYKSNIKMNSVVFKGGVNLDSDINLSSDSKDLKLKSGLGINGSVEYNRVLNSVINIGAGATIDSDVKIKSDIKDYKNVGMVMIPVYAFVKIKKDLGMIDPYIQLKCGYSDFLTLNDSISDAGIESDIYYGANVGFEIGNFILDSGYSVENYIAVDKTTEKDIYINYPKISVSAGYKLDF